MTVAVRLGVSTSSGQNNNIITLTWTGLDGDDVGEWIDVSDFADKTVHIYGTFDSATVVIQGSNDPVCLTDAQNAAAVSMRTPQGTVISKTAADLITLLENPKFIRPVVSGGGASTALKVVIQGKRIT